MHPYSRHSCKTRRTIVLNYTETLLRRLACLTLGATYLKSMSETQDEQIARYRTRLEEVAELVARIRHEINNPLTGVLGQAQLLLREDLNDRARKRAQTIEELAIRIRDIVAQLRDVQRPGSES
jgi:signal transduction histidine kinase